MKLKLTTIFMLVSLTGFCQKVRFDLIPGDAMIETNGVSASVLEGYSTTNETIAVSNIAVSAKSQADAANATGAVHTAQITGLCASNLVHSAAIAANTIWITAYDTDTNCTPASLFSYYTNDSQIVITAYTGTDTDIVIPRKINGFPVTRMEGNNISGWFDPQVLTSVRADSVKYIEAFAFYEHPLTNAVMPNLYSVGCGVFEFTPLSSIALPELIYVGRNMFYGCTNLMAVDLPRARYIGVDDVDNLFHSSSEAGGSETFTLCQFGALILPAAEIINGFMIQGCYNLTNITLKSCRVVEGSLYDIYPRTGPDHVSVYFDSIICPRFDNPSWVFGTVTGTLTNYVPAGAVGWSATLDGYPVVSRLEDYYDKSEVDDLTATKPSYSTVSNISSSVVGVLEDQLYTDVYVLTNMYSDFTVTNINLTPYKIYGTGIVDISFANLGYLRAMPFEVSGFDNVTFSNSYAVGGFTWQTNQVNIFTAFMSGTNNFVNPVTTRY